MASEILDFLESKNILITGATGFLGKVLLEKLLRTSKQSGSIYVLIRPLKGCTAQERLQSMLKTKLFAKLRRSDPQALAKVVAISGSMLEPELSLSEADRHMLHANINIVFHCAATVKFDEALSLSVKLNVVGTHRLIAECHKMRQLKAFVHVSTAYANCDRSTIDETVYPTPLEPEQLMQSLEWMSEEMVQLITPKILAKRPNTYTYTKALAEHLVAHESGDLPAIIIRPSIIGAVWREPAPGWVDNYNGPTGLFAAVGKGLLRSMLGKNDAIADIIPVDVVSNLMIAAAWHIAKEKSNNGVPVINCCSGQLRPIPWCQVTDQLELNFTVNPFNEVVCIPRPRLTMSRLSRNFNIFINHLLPAYALDLISTLCGRRPRMVGMYDKLLRAVASLEYFTMHSWNFKSANILSLWESLSPEDQKHFPFDVRLLDWQGYLANYCVGVKEFLMNEDMSQVDLARKRFQRLKIWITVLNIAFYGMILKMLVSVSKSQWLKQLWFAIVLLINRLLFLIPGFHKLVLPMSKWSTIA